MENSIEYKSLSGEEARDYLEELASMRISFFRAFPYLYDGTIEYEKQYLEKYFKSENSHIVIAFENSQIIGFCSSIPLLKEEPAIQNPLISKNEPLEDYLYIGEIILSEKYRGQGIARKLFEIQELYAKKNGFSKAMLITVNREVNDNNKPLNYKDLDSVWKTFGYQKLKNDFVEMCWPRVDKKGENLCNKLSIWIKNLV